MPAPTPITQVVLGTTPDEITMLIAATEGFDYGIDEGGPYRSVVYEVDETASVTSVGEQACNLLRGVSNYTTTPQVYPGPHRYPGNATLVCVSAGLKDIVGCPMPSPTLMKSSEAVHILAKYRQVSWDVDGSILQPVWDLGYPVPWSTLRVRAASEHYAVEGVSTLTESTKVKRARARLPIVDYEIGRTMIDSNVNYTAVIKGIIGGVNNASFAGFDRGTLWFETWDATPVQDPSGIWVWQFMLHVKWRPKDWNLELVPGTVATWDYLKDDGGTAAVYQFPYVDPVPLMSYGII